MKMVAARYTWRPCKLSWSL